MRFLVDRCVGRRVARWLRAAGHDVVDAPELGADPGDRALLARAYVERRVLVTLDADFGELIYLHDVPHAGLVRLPDLPTEKRIVLMAQLIDQHREALDSAAVVTVRGGLVRISQSSSQGKP